MPTKKNDKDNAIDLARSEFFAQFLAETEKTNPGEFRTLDDNSIIDVETYSTGAISLDVALGVGGLPKGRIVEIYGTTGGGKTTLALATAVNCQAKGGFIGFVDCEHALSVELAKNMGIDPSRFVIYQPTSGEDAIDKIVQMLESKAFDMIVVDSVAAMVPQKELDADAEQGSMGQHAKLMSRFMRKVTGLVSEADTLLLCLNQTRKNLGAYVVTDTPTGGNAIGFASSVRISVRTSNSKRIERKGELVGTTVTAEVVKNKLASPFKKAEYDVMFGVGINAGGSLLAVGEKMGVVERRGASYTEVATGERFAVGKDNAKAEIDSNDELRERLVTAVYDALKNGVVANDDSGEETEEDMA